jgi:hypothetical protein
MTAQFRIGDVAGQHRRRTATVTLAAASDFESNVRSNPLDRRFGVMAEILAAAMRAGVQRILAALHDARRKQAAIELARHRDLIYDPETAIAFGMDRTLRPRS